MGQDVVQDVGQDVAQNVGQDVGQNVCQDVSRTGRQLGAITCRLMVSLGDLVNVRSAGLTAN